MSTMELMVESVSELEELEELEDDPVSALIMVPKDEIPEESE